MILNFSLQFSFHFGGHGEKILEPHHLFSFIPIQPNILKKVFLPIFLLIFPPKFSIHFISSLNKHTLTVILAPLSLSLSLSLSLLIIMLKQDLTYSNISYYNEMVHSIEEKKLKFLLISL